MERLIEKSLYASRWLLAPIYLGLSVALIALSIKFFQELYHVFSHVIVWSESDLVLVLLSLVDMSLVAGLLVMVMFSGYENFVSKLDIDEGTERLGWLGKYDVGTLKLKVAASIVAISSIHLLRAFMNMENIPAEELNTRMTWYVVTHMAFVISALLMGYLDKLSFSSHRDDH